MQIPAPGFRKIPASDGLSAPLLQLIALLAGHADQLIRYHLVVKTDSRSVGQKGSPSFRTKQRERQWTASLPAASASSLSIRNDLRPLKKAVALRFRETIERVAVNNRPDRPGTA